MRCYATLKMSIKNMIFHLFTTQRRKTISLLCATWMKIQNNVGFFCDESVKKHHSGFWRCVQFTVGQSREFDRKSKQRRLERERERKRMHCLISISFLSNMTKQIPVEWKVVLFFFSKRYYCLLHTPIITSNFDKSLKWGSQEETYILWPFHQCIYTLESSCWTEIFLQKSYSLSALGSLFVATERITN